MSSEGLKGMTMSYLTTKQAAARLTLSPNTLEVWRVRGKGPRYVKLGRAVRYRESDLDEFVEKGTRGNTSDVVAA